MTLEEAMIYVKHATDPSGRPVVLHRGPIDSDSLRQSARNFADTLTEESTVFFSLEGIDQKLCEAAAWENLAKLANATAAALREGK